MNARQIRRGSAVAATGMVVASILTVVILARVDRSQGDPGASPRATRISRNGVDVEFLVKGAGGASGAREGDSLELRFRVTDTATGEPLRGRSVAAWLDSGAKASAGDAACREKVPLYLRGLVGVRPLVDLNTYFVVVMNQDASLSVVDPVVGMTGKTNLYATILLRRPGADFARSDEGRRLHVSMPDAGQVAVIDTERFEVVANVDAGERPTRVAIQPDGRLVWVGNDAADPGRSGVTAYDPESRKVVAFIPTGRGHHEIAFSGDDRRAFVTNRVDGTVSVIDVAALAKVRDVEVGGVLLSITRSPLSRALYVTDGEGGRITVLDPDDGEVLARIASRPGIGPLRFSQDGRWGFALNPAEHAVEVIDASTNRIAHTLPAGGEPYQVAFTRTFAYVRLLDSVRVPMIRLETLGGEGKPTIHGFDAGTRPPRAVPDLALADAIVSAIDEAGVFVASPGDNAVYFYMEGMNAPMGSHGGYGHSIRAVTLADRSVKEIAPGEYMGSVRVPAPGRYDVAFLLDAPRLVHCFGFDAEPNPMIRREAGGVALEHLELSSRVPAGAAQPIRFRLMDPSTGKALTGIRDATVVAWLLPASPAVHTPARELEPGTYEARPVFRRAGTWYVHVAIPSKGVAPGKLGYRGLRVVEPELSHADPMTRPSPTLEGAER